jgi:hypothetical protein
VLTDSGLVRHNVRCRGRNNKGQLGNGTTTDGPVPIEVMEL